MPLSTRQQLIQLNRLYKESDEIYHDISAGMGLSDSSLMILYGICYADHPCTQSELSETWSMKKQTVRSALNSLLRQGYIYLEPLRENPHIKQIFLTEAGKNIAEKTAIPLINAERAAFEQLTVKEREILLELSQKQVDYMKKEADKLLQWYQEQYDGESK